MTHQEQDGLPRELLPIDTDLALEMLYALISTDPDCPNLADAILAQYEIDTEKLDKIPRFFIDSRGNISYYSERKKKMGFIQNGK